MAHPSERKEKYKNAILADDAESNTLAVTRVTNDESNVIKFPRASKVDDVSKGNPGNPEQVKNALQHKFGLSFDNRKKETALPNKNSSSHVFASLFQNLKAKVKVKKKPSLTKWLANIKNKMQKKTEKSTRSNIAPVVEKPLEPFSHGGKLAVICNSLIKKMPEAYEQFAHLQLTDSSSWLIKVGVVDNHVLSKVMTLSDANHLAESLKKLMGGDERIKVHFSESAGKEAIKNYRVYIPKDLIEAYYNNNTPELNLAKEEHTQSLVRMYNDALEWVRNHQTEVNKECQIPENIQFSRIILDKSNPETPFKIYMTGTDVPIQAEITLNNLVVWSRLQRESNQAIAYAELSILTKDFISLDKNDRIDFMTTFYNQNEAIQKAVLLHQSQDSLAKLSTERPNLKTLLTGLPSQEKLEVLLSKEADKMAIEKQKPAETHHLTMRP